MAGLRVGQAGGRRALGFSLIELCVALVVLAILTTLALPSFFQTIRSHQLQSHTEALRSALSYARTEAVVRQYSVSLCASANGLSCSTANDYSGGWLVYTTPAGAAGSVYTAASNTLLRTTQVDLHTATQASTANVISFGAQGQLLSASAVQFTSCPRSGTTGAGQSTSAVPGNVLTLTLQGSIQIQPQPASASCGASSGNGQAAG